MPPRLSDRLRIVSTEILSRNWAELRTVVFDFLRSDGSWQRQTREIYDRGDGVAVLPIDPVRGTVILIRQFRIPVYQNGWEQLFVEAPAGALGRGEDPEKRARMELSEEAGYDPLRMKLVMETYMSPGSVTEKLFLYLAEYSRDSKRGPGGGLRDEGEDIELLELPLDEAVARIGADIRDAKTILLLQWAKRRLEQGLSLF